MESNGEINLSIEGREEIRFFMRYIISQTIQSTIKNIGEGKYLDKHHTFLLQQLTKEIDEEVSQAILERYELEGLVNIEYPD